MVDIETLYKAYKAIHRQYDRVKNQINAVDKQLTRCDRLQKDFLNDYRKSLVDKLDGINIALDIIFKAIKQNEFY